MNKLENPVRLAELSPPETLARLGLQDGMSFADIGAGSGIFTTAAAARTRAPVFAVDPSETMRGMLEEKKRKGRLEQVQIFDDIAKLPAGAADLALLCTVQHEIAERASFLAAVREKLKPGGCLAVIEFHKAPSPFGPPPAVRIGEDEVARLALSAGMEQTCSFSLGENFYCACFRA